MEGRTIVVFDLDDTLYYEREYVESGFSCISSILSGAFIDASKNEIFEALIREFDTGDRAMVFDALLDAYPSAREKITVNELVAAYREHLPVIKLNPGVKELIAALRDHDVSVGLISDGFRAAQMRKIQALQLKTLLGKIILTDIWGRDYWKPHHKCFLMMERRFGRDRNKTYWYVGDNPEKDFVAPNRIGWNTVRYMNDSQLRFGAGYPTEAHRPGYELYSYEQILEVVLMSHRSKLNGAEIQNAY